jgi:hypothetical protein
MNHTSLANAVEGAGTAVRHLCRGIFLSGHRGIGPALTGNMRLTPRIAQSDTSLMTAKQEIS